MTPPSVILRPGFSRQRPAIPEGYMSRARRLALAATVLVVLGSTAAQTLAAHFSVYYRPSAGSAWSFYAGKPTRGAAEATVNHLRELGFQTEIVADGQPAPKTIVTAPTVVGSVALPGRLGLAHTGGFRTVFAGGGPTVVSSTTHHYSHRHVVHKAHVNHPTRHPHHNVHAHHHKQLHKKAAKHAHHHAKHNAHHHAHHHSHAH